MSRIINATHLEKPKSIRINKNGSSLAAGNNKSHFLVNSSINHYIHVVCKSLYPCSALIIKLTCSSSYIRLLWFTFYLPTGEKKQKNNFQSPNTPTPRLPSSSWWMFWDRLDLGWASPLETKGLNSRGLFGAASPPDALLVFGVWPRDRECDHWTVWLLRETISLHAADGPSWENLCQTGSWQWGEGTSYFHRSP